MNGFLGTGIWPLNVHIVDSMLGPSELFSFPVEEDNMGYENLGASSRSGLSDCEELQGAHEQPEAAHSEDKDQLDVDHDDRIYGQDDDEADHEDHDYEEVQGG
jgi:hypothetical protein